jgi:pseudaminic acid cytidylyltransferase
MSNVAIITARGGSKRIPRKNIKLFRGKPIIAYSIETALQSELFDMVMVSTDDKEIAEISIKYGAIVPFLRSAKNSDDHSTTTDVIIEVLEQLQKNDKYFEYACAIYPTAPLLTTSNLKMAFTLLKEKKYGSAFPVCAFSYPILRALKISDGKINMIWPENILKRSQDLPPAYHDAGQFYWMHIATFLRERKLITENSGVLILDEMQTQDIDSETDWKMAELKWEILHA